MSLAIGRELHYYQWDILPVGENLICRVHGLDLSEGQPKIDKNFKFEWSIDGELAFESEHDTEEE